MIARARTLPLGLDLGASRIRIALARAEADGSARVTAVASRDVAGDPALLPALLEEMVAELGTRERRCVTSVGVPRATLRIMKLPKMTWAERVRTARFEAEQFAEWDVHGAPTGVRIHEFDRSQGLYAIGATRTGELEALGRLLRSSGLRSVAVDHDAFALRRVLPLCDAIVDVGLERSTLHVYEAASVRSIHIPLGGACVTRGIAQDLSIDALSAERRKRILGSAGAGNDARDELVRAIATAVERSRARSPITRLALTGNGARLPGIGPSLETSTGAIVEIPVAQSAPYDAYPHDVIRSAAPDWALAIALSTWGCAS
jgi:Tfp pilus assembly PilM family ATPase